MQGKNHTLIHPESGALLETLLTMLRDYDDETVFRYIREEVLHNS